MEEKKRIPAMGPNGAFRKESGIPVVTDPMGSYTGVPENPYETPVQDADDL